MQWVLTAIVWVLMVGGLAGYLAARGQAPLAPQRVLATAEQQVRIELRSTAALGGGSDPFALDPLAAQPAVTLLLRDATGGERRQVVESLAPGQVEVVVLPGLIAGRNEILVETAPTPEPAALQLRIVVDGQPQRAELLWLEPGQPTVATLPLGLAPQSRPHAHEGQP